jgi:hypothetical protein
MRSKELALKIIDTLIKNSLLIGFLQELTLQVYMYAFVNTSVMVVHPTYPHVEQTAGSGIILTLRICAFVHLYAFVNTSDMDHPNVASCGTSRRVRDYPDPAHSSW